MASANSTNTPINEMTTSEYTEMMLDPTRTSVNEFFTELTDSKSRIFRDSELSIGVCHIEKFDLHIIYLLLTGPGDNYENRFNVFDIFACILCDIYEGKSNSGHMGIFKRNFQRFCSCYRKFVQRDILCFGGLVKNSNSPIYRSFFGNCLFERFTIPIIQGYFSEQTGLISFVLDKDL